MDFDINQEDHNGNTLLTLAVGEARGKAVRALALAGARVEERKNGKTMFGVQVCRNDIMKVQALLEGGVPWIHLMDSFGRRGATHTAEEKPVIQDCPRDCRSKRLPIRLPKQNLSVSFSSLASLFSCLFLSSRFFSDPFLFLFLFFFSFSPQHIVGS